MEIESGVKVGFDRWGIPEFDCSGAAGKKTHCEVSHVIISGVSSGVSSVDCFLGHGKLSCAADFSQQHSVIYKHILH